MAHVVGLLALLARPVTFACGFCPSRMVRSEDRRGISATSARISSLSNNEPFDYSSKLGWDNFYQEGVSHEGKSSELASKMESSEYEWHPHIHPSTIVEATQQSIAMAAEHYSRVDPSEPRLPSILLVGSGNSALPRILHDAFEAPVRVTCLDYSSVCIDALKSAYGPSYPNMDFVVGDATRLQEALRERNHYDVVIDKGLLDALMCGEGFGIESFIGGINRVLTPNEWGLFILISFQLSSSSRGYLSDVPQGGAGLAWSFDVPVEGSENGRGCFNVARRSNL